MPDETKIPNFLPFGVLATIFCCPPLGVIAVIYACKVNTALAQDNPAQAMLSAEKAKFWSVISVLVGVLAYLAAWLYVAVI